MTEFSGVASKRCLQQMDISLPKVTMVLPSHHFYEVLYNRLATDLCLWEPSAPEYFTRCNMNSSHFHSDIHKPPSYGGLGSAVLQGPIPGMLLSCKSGIAYGKLPIPFFKVFQVFQMSIFVQILVFLMF